MKMIHSSLIIHVELRSPLSVSYTHSNERLDTNCASIFRSLGQSSRSKTAEKVVQDLINDVIPKLPIEPELCKNYNQLHGCLITIKNGIEVLNEVAMNAPKEEKYTLFQVGAIQPQI